MTAKRAELGWQNKICDSLKASGGYGAKWASEWVSGPPDLICSLPDVGGFLIEVKHLPTWQGGKIKNPMTELQKDWARRYTKAGCFVFLGIVYGGTKATTASRLLLTSPLGDDTMNHGGVAAYVLGRGFDMRKVVNDAIRIIY